MNNILQSHPEIILQPSATIRAAMSAMTASRMGIVLVTDASGRLLGVITDIDVRRALLRGASLDSPVSAALNRKPIILPVGTPAEAVTAAFRKHGKSSIPLVDGKGRLCDLAELSQYVTIPRRYANRVVIMAGGTGMRLRPLTEHTPKPMLKIGEKPILEYLIEQMSAAGFARFTLTVNYLADQIKRHFGDGSRWGVEIDYIQEAKPLGTAGALRLLKKDHDDSLIVLNGDILTKVDFQALLDFHRTERSLATICVKHHEIQVPYGVVEQSRRRLKRLVEKPTHRFLVNAGIYVVDPRALAWLPPKPLDMPAFLSLIRRRRAAGVACFPLMEYWLDIGGPQEFNRAGLEFGEIFGK